MFGRNSRRPEVNLSSEAPDLFTEEQAYFRVHGTYPPIVSPETTPEELEVQIRETKAFAEATHDFELAERLAHEIGYLANKLGRKNG